ncbi:S8 family serine peptidase [Streptomyces sp. NPDC085639]|uniref:S8 family serine peptidase n=1 Tax=Streptomyces sp. NPDC085639 TaxID=3365734 RepID=UPI0037D0302C
MADACTESPASAPNAVPVGTQHRNDKLLPRSKFGKCVEVLGPGKDIVSTWPRTVGTTVTKSGTAMAAAHAAGIAAIFLSAQPLTNAQLNTKILSTSTKNAVAGLPSSTPQPAAVQRLLIDA